MNKKDKSVHPFSIIKYFNSPNEAVTLDGRKVHREDKIYFHQIGRFVKCAPYDNHFLYHDPMFNTTVGRWTPMCTCGAMGWMVGYNAYRQDASPSNGGSGLVPGELLVCSIHAQTGKHADGST